MSFKEDRIEVVSIQTSEIEGYDVIFRLNNLKDELKERIIKRHESGLLKSMGADVIAIEEINGNLYIEEHHNDLRDYRSLINLVHQEIPERLDPAKVEVEVDLCMIEQSIAFIVDIAGKSIDELKSHYKYLGEYLDKIKENHDDIPITASHCELVEGVSK